MFNPPRREPCSFRITTARSNSYTIEQAELILNLSFYACISLLATKFSLPVFRTYNCPEDVAA